MTSAHVVRRAGDRFATRGSGLQTWHGFSFGPHYDPAHVAHGRLVVCDEHLLEPGAGFPPHPHRDVQIVSWVLAGELRHEHDAGTTTVPAGSLQRLDTGAGVVHAERAGPEGARFLQLWLTGSDAATPSYDLVPVTGLAEVLPGVHAGRLDGGWTVPDAARVHLQVAAGSCSLGDLLLQPGDAVRMTAAGPQEVHGQADVLLVVPV